MSAFDCMFCPISEEVWSASTDGRAMLFMPYNPTSPAQGTGKYSLYMKTRYANSNGHYLLRLRNEYQINWDLDEYKVDFTNTAEGGKVYATENAITLPNLMANPNITLILSE